MTFIIEKKLDSFPQILSRILDSHGNGVRLIDTDLETPPIYANSLHPASLPRQSLIFEGYKYNLTRHIYDKEEIKRLTDHFSP